MKFNELNLHPDVLRGIVEAEFTDCTPVQAQTISHVLAGKDVIVQSQTGTGKTAAFLIPLFQLALENDKEQKEIKGPRALILAPTRELAIQIQEEAQMLGKYLPYTYGAFYGGVGYGAQEALVLKGVDFIIGTPGRLLDFERSKKLHFGEIENLVVDEADRMFDMGFYPDIMSILQRMKSRRQRRTLLFSATIGTRVMNIAWEHMNEPVEVTIEPEQITVEAITQELYHISLDEKIPALLGILKRYNPENAIIFTNTKRAAEEVSERLKINGFTCEFIMGDLPQTKRLKIITSLKKNELKFLVATDVAARGLHVDDLEMVINYDLPEDPENYVHRIGRTARAGKTGKAISFSDERFVYGLPAIEQLIGRKIPVVPVDENLFIEDKSRGMRIRTSRNSGDRDRPGFSNTRHPRTPGGVQKRSVRSAVPDTPRRRSEKSLGSDKHTLKPTLTQNKPSSQPVKNRKRPRNMSPEERIDYYKQKYGESFDPSRLSISKDTNLTSSGPKTPQRKAIQRKSGDQHKKQHQLQDAGSNATRVGALEETGAQSKKPSFLKRVLGKLFG
jgi:ATP-dependent RNA helicase RhlB